MLLNYGVGEDSWESLRCKEAQPVNPKGNQSWVFTGGTDAEAEAPILWPPDMKNCLFGKYLDAGKDSRQEKGMTVDEMVWTASPTQWTWVWASSRSWWWTGKPGVLQSMDLQRFRHDWMTVLYWTELTMSRFQLEKIFLLHLTTFFNWNVLLPNLLLSGGCFYHMASMLAQTVKNTPAMWETWFQFLDWEGPWIRKWIYTPVFWPGEFHGLFSPWCCKE